MKREFGLKDALTAIDREITECEDRQHHRKAERLRKYREWLHNGCHGRKPKV